ncbi:MAG: LamG-like jellyroll fold domain-containing protein, partial [Bacteroidota bacterium]|nr:LamG-like jellyroll fold domain-containing protein [Bacteroidota bacterium]
TPLGATDISNSVWHHIALTKDNILVGRYTKMNFTFYVDGILLNTWNPIDNSDDLNNSDELRIGDSYVSSDYFNGLIDDLRIWKGSARTQTQIRDNMYNEIGTSGNLVAYYKFAETTGTTASDETTNHNGTLNNMSNADWITSTIPMPFTTKSGASNWSSTGSWTSGTIPNVSWAPVKTSHDIIVDDDYETEKLTIITGTVSINPTSSLSVNGNLVNSGTIKIKSDAAGNVGSLIDNGTITGTQKLERILSEGGWHYISSPISSASSWLFTGAAMYEYDEPNGEYDALSGGVTMTVMRGYDVYYIGTSSKTVTFDGSFNTGSKTYSLTYNASDGQGYNLVGNPYPSTIDWEASSGWTDDYVNATVTIWDPGSGAISTYVRGTGTTNDGSRYIPASQGFFVQCTQATTLGMTNDVRVTNTMTARSNNKTNELRMKVIGSKNSDESLIVFNPNATYNYDGKYDGRKMFSLVKSDPQIYSVNQNSDEFAINSIPFQKGSFYIPLYLYSGVGENNTLEFDLSKLNISSDVYLEDIKSGEIINIRNNESYHFYATPLDNPYRFRIHFSPCDKISNTTITDNPKNNVNVYSSDNFIFLSFINSTNQLATISVYDIAGKQVLSKEIQTSALQKIELNSPAGVYIVTVTVNNNRIAKRISIW